MEPFRWELPESQAPAPDQKPAGPALRRFRPNRSVSVSLEQGTPIHLECSGHLNGTVREQAGPYLASGNWWDDKAWNRQEWDAELGNGIVCRLHTSNGNWEVDGIYD
jgi:hypothetical protein